MYSNITQCTVNGGNFLIKYWRFMCESAWFLSVAEMWEKNIKKYFYDIFKNLFEEFMFYEINTKIRYITNELALSLLLSSTPNISSCHHNISSLLLFFSDNPIQKLESDTQKLSSSENNSIKRQKCT